MKKYSSVQSCKEKGVVCNADNLLPPNQERDVTTFSKSSIIDEMVQEYIENIILANIVPAHLEWDKVIRNRIHSRTAENYIYLLRRHFLVNFTGRIVASIETSELQEHFKRIAQKYSNSLITKVHFLVYRMYNRAKKKWGLDNPLISDGFCPPVSMRIDKKVEPYSNDEMKRLLSGIDDHDVLKPIINLATATGCRIQEILNLRWKHIDFKNGSVRIERALTLNIIFDENGFVLSRHSIDGRTKRQSSERTLFIDEYTIGLLKEWREYAAQHTKTEFGLGDYVFGNKRGSYYTYGGFRSVLRRHLEKKYGKNHCLSALHRIRHTVATKAAEEGASTVELMQLLGDNQERSVLRYTGKSSTIAMKNRDRISKSMIEIRKL